MTDPTLVEGNSGTRNLVYSVKLANPSDFPVTVGYATGTGTATAGGDYTPVSGTLTFAPGATSLSVSVPVFGDTNLQGLPAGGPNTNLPYMMKSLTSIVADWRYAIPQDPTDPNSPTFPVLYVAGDGGVVRSINAL